METPSCSLIAQSGALLALGWLTVLPDPAAAQVLSVEQCRSSVIGANGVQHHYGGQVTIEYLVSQDTHMVRGAFQDQFGNRADFEVITNQPHGGVGGLWFNHQAHRQTHIELRRVAGGYLLADYEGGEQTIGISCR